ncbi:MAG: pyruvate kinase alpha/beta domain-containing protein [Promethearchaeota archaeon]
MEFKALFFEKPGDHTAEVFEVARRAMDAWRVRDVVVASTTGATAKAAADFFDLEGVNLVVVTHSFGFAKPGENEMGTRVRQDLEQRGVRVVTGTHALSGVDSALVKKLNLWSPVGLFQRALRWVVCEGFKVCLEIVAMAVDAGAIAEGGPDVVAVAGTGRGADTACVLSPVGSRNFLDARVKAVLAKPQ